LKVISIFVLNHKENSLKTRIRKEVPADFPVVFDLIEAAFKSMPLAEGNEQFIVEKLRKNEAFIPELSLVAEVDGQVAGHILFTPLEIVNDTTVFKSLTLGPVAVFPEIQHLGIGSELVREGHRVAKNLGFTSCFLVGHPEYYPRFGYVPASRWAVQLPIDAPPEAFMAIELTQGALDGVSGMLRFLPEFGIADEAS
jgi:predicted N-acetyltransferase YhbS